MATRSKLSPARRARHALVLLFREARRLQRQRRRRYAGVLIAACAVAGAGGFLIARDTSDSPAASGGRPAPVLVSLKLPRAGDYFSLAVVGTRVLVSGGPRGSLFPTGVTSLSDGRAVGSCDAAEVEPGTLRLGPVAHANCGDPALYGELVLAISYSEHQRPPADGISEFAIRIAHRDARARDGYTLGPVVMTYPQCSDCDAQWIYGDGSLWLYAAYDGEMSHSAGELLRVANDGRVAQRWAIPQDPRELLAADDDGLWFAPSLEGGYPPHLRGSQRIDYQSLYRVTPGARAPKRVFDLGAGGADWLVAAGHTVWIDDNSFKDKGRRVHNVLWRLQGPGATPVLHAAYAPNSDEGGDIGESPATHAGNAAIGIYYVSDPGYGSDESATQRVMRLSPNAAGQRVVSKVPAPLDIGSYGAGPPGVALGRSFYFLNPPLLDYRQGDKPPIVQGRGVLYRVTPRRRAVN
jgi:hypothetical protein